MRYLQKFVFLALALCIVVSLPLAASAMERTEGTEGLFLAKVNDLTDHGAPREGTTRAQYLTILYDAAGAPAVTGESAYPDVSPDTAYASAIIWAEQKGITKAERGHNFDPDAIIAEEEAAETLSSALAALGETAQQLAQGILAARVGYAKEEDFLLTFHESTKEPRTTMSAALLQCPVRVSHTNASNSHGYIQAAAFSL